MRILACDLSLTGSAFALLEIEKGKLIAVRTIFVNNKNNLKEGNGGRLNNIVDHLEQFIQGITIDYVVAERGFTKFNNSTQALFRVVGVVEYIMYKQGFSNLEFISPTTVKKTIVGKGNSSKEEVLTSLQGFLPTPLDFQTYDESDAVAVGITFCIIKNFLNNNKSEDAEFSELHQ